MKQNQSPLVSFLVIIGIYSVSCLALAVADTPTPAEIVIQSANDRPAAAQKTDAPKVKTDSRRSVALQRLRTKQTSLEQRTIRIVSQNTIRHEQICHSDQMVRKRLKEIGKYRSVLPGAVALEAGNDDMTIDNNHGTINNTVNVQMVNPHAQDCL